MKNADEWPACGRGVSEMRLRCGRTESLHDVVAMRQWSGWDVVKGRVHEIFDFWFFHESVSPKPLSKGSF